MSARGGILTTFKATLLSIYDTLLLFVWLKQVEPEGTSALAAGSRALFLETVRRSNAACQNGDYSLAATLYTEALALDPLSHVLYSNRSAARLKMGLFALALQDAVRATELVPQWPKVLKYSPPLQIPFFL